MYRQIDRHPHPHASDSPGVHLEARLFNDPIAQAFDQTETLGNRDKNARQDHSSLGMVPAQQCFHAADPAVTPVHLWLVVQLELAELDRMSKVVL